MFVLENCENSIRRQRPGKREQNSIMVKMTESREVTWRIFTNVQKCIDNTLGECYYNAKETSYELRKKWGERSA
jgi:hypothetical protein